ncbi:MULTISPECIES: hypothetical protein [unclassified Leucobacter]|uniref:hypothetical protein n=1 Tax=unclassified Leucobacter TaxID=2621730 RepID=UPI00165D93BF|nr:MULTISPECIES: hypothetical protein [unclassified Leucobacter]MBC9937138.1 hypothetical protein [Leucobacter sp. cx-87]
MTASVRRLRRVRTRAIPSYLVVAQSADLDDLRLTLAMLPICAHGRVIVVAEPGEQIAPLALPSRMSVTVRVRRAEQGAAAAALQTVHAWASEMLCDSERDDPSEPRVVAWVAGSDAAFIDELGHLLCEGHGLPGTALRTGAGFGAARA